VVFGPSCRKAGGDECYDLGHPRLSLYVNYIHRLPAQQYDAKPIAGV